MSCNQSYAGGVLAEQWSSGTLAGDPAAGYTAFNADGTVKTTRALTAAEMQRLTAQDAAVTASTNQATIQANIQAHIGQLETWLTANPNGAVLTAAQTKFVAQTLIGLGRIVLGLTSTVGGAT